MKAMTRRKFIGGTLAAAATGCMNTRSSIAPCPAEGSFIWGDLLHLGMNMWCDWENPAPPGANVEEVKIRWPSQKVRAEMDVWRAWTDAMAREKLNMAVIDLGEALVYPSHPEIAAKGAFTPEQMRAELDRLRAQGIETVPKLNFSASHNRWLNEYRAHMGSALYRKVCAEIIADVCEIFERPRFFHIGYDEESNSHQSRFQHMVIRRGDVWWRDFLSVVDAVEKCGARAWCFSDMHWHHPDDFMKRMPKSVVQCPWNYQKDEKHPEYCTSLDALLDAGYDMIPDVGTFVYQEKDGISTVEGDNLFERFAKSAPPILESFLTKNSVMLLERKEAAWTVSIKIFISVSVKALLNT